MLREGRLRGITAGLSSQLSTLGDRALPALARTEAYAFAPVSMRANFFVNTKVSVCVCVCAYVCGFVAVCVCLCRASMYVLACVCANGIVNS